MSLERNGNRRHTEDKPSEGNAMERRLAAILAADVVGYSRMMAANETATLAALQRHRSEVLKPAITSHRGRVVKLMGDGLLAEFSSIVEAVDCAVEVQRDMAQRNDAVANEVRIAFRIGVHIGDVIVEGDDLYGDGVNIAARLEAIADIGGVCISGAAHDEIESKLDLTFRALGPQTLKNLPRPVVAYAVDVGGVPGVTSSPASTEQEIRYCRTPEGVRLAYSVVGKGPPLVRCGRWFTHLESLASGQNANRFSWLTSNASSNWYAGSKNADWIGIFSNIVTERTCSNV
jgi:class 3 adenylate cyclase